MAYLADYIPLDFGDDPPGCQLAETATKILNALARVGGSNHRLATYQETDGINLVDAGLAKPV